MSGLNRSRVFLDCCSCHQPLVVQSFTSHVISLDIDDWRNTTFTFGLFKENIGFDSDVKSHTQAYV